MHGLFDSQALIAGAGLWGLAIVAVIVFAETGLLAGFFLPGDTLLFFTGVLTFSGHIGQPLWVVIAVVAGAAILGDQFGHLVGWHTGPRIFDRRESGLFSKRSVERTQHFFDRFGPVTVTMARFVPIVRTFAPVAAGVGRMPLGRFTAYNAAGGILWSGVMTGTGFVLAMIPGVADFVAGYIDIILIVVVCAAVLPVLVRGIVLRVKRGRAASSAPAPAID